MGNIENILRDNAATRRRKKKNESILLPTGSTLKPRKEEGSSSGSIPQPRSVPLLDQIKRQSREVPIQTRAYPKGSTGTGLAFMGKVTKPSIEFASPSRRMSTSPEARPSMRPGARSPAVPSYNEIRERVERTNAPPLEKRRTDSESVSSKRKPTSVTIRSGNSRASGGAGFGVSARKRAKETTRDRQRTRPSTARRTSRTRTSSGFKF